MKRKLVMVTAYDYPTSKIADEIGFDYILVGDSLGMVVLGYKDTKSVTIDEMLHHTKAVARGAKNSFIIADMPVNTYNSKEDALKNAKLLLNAGANGVKIEGSKLDIISALIKENISVVGHLGLLPQTAKKYTVQGKDKKTAEKLYSEAKALDYSGIKLLILECIPQSLAKRITEGIVTPTIGIGAGKYCDGQVLVLHDIIGLSGFQGKMVKKYADARKTIKKALIKFREEVITEKFPQDKNSFI